MQHITNPQGARASSRPPGQCSSPGRSRGAPGALLVRAAVVLAAASVLAGCGGAGGPASPAGSGSTSPGTTSSTSPGATSSTSPATSRTATPPTSTATSSVPTAERRLTAIPVYWVGESHHSFALYREFRTVPDVGGPVASAVAAMTRMKPLDPDYFTPWRPARRVAVTQRGASLTVDLSRDAVSGTQVGSEVAARAVQQLVYTATAAAHTAGKPASTVTITIDGRPSDAWGVVRLGSPTARAPQLEVQAQAWVTSPQEGEVRHPGTVAFTGYGTSFEATFGWKVTDRTGHVVAHGSAMGGTGTGGFGTVRFSARLSAGTYTVVLSTDDPSGGEGGREPATDSKRFVVR